MDQILLLQFVDMNSIILKLFDSIQVTLTYNNQHDSIPGGTFDLRFSTANNKFLTTAHQLLNGKLIQFLNRTRSLKQFIRVKNTQGYFRIDEEIFSFSYYI